MDEIRGRVCLSDEIKGIVHLSDEINDEPPFQMEKGRNE
jgi:hypothetical protein